jgi:hypothetical protein
VLEISVSISRQIFCGLGLETFGLGFGHDLEGLVSDFFFKPAINSGHLSDTKKKNVFVKLPIQI